jgi:ketosteroid isomerase-like protein
MDLADVPHAITAFIDATNAADPDAFVAAFTDDATLVDWGRTFGGHEGIRRWDAAENIGVQTHFDLLALEPAGDPETYVATIRVSGNGYNGTGPMLFELRDGLVATLRIGPDVAPG